MIAQQSANWIQFSFISTHYFAMNCRSGLPAFKINDKNIVILVHNVVPNTEFPGIQMTKGKVFLQNLDLMLKLYTTAFAV